MATYVVNQNAGIKNGRDFRIFGKVEKVGEEKRTQVVESFLDEAGKMKQKKGYTVKYQCIRFRTYIGDDKTKATEKVAVKVTIAGFSMYVIEDEKGGCFISKKAINAKRMTLDKELCETELQRAKFAVYRKYLLKTMQLASMRFDTLQLKAEKESA